MPETGSSRTERPVIFVTQYIAGLEELSGRAEVLRAFGPDAVSLADVIGEVDGILIRSQYLTGDDIRGATRLRVICRVGAGLEKIDVAAASAAGIPVFNSAGANAHTVTEMTFGLAISVIREIPKWDAATRAGQFARKEENPGGELFQKTWGIIGLGHIGSEVARTARLGFGMDVLAWHPSRPAGWIEERGAEAVAELTELLERSDVVSVHVPITDQTRDLLGAEQFAKMRPGSVLVNMSRGGVVNEAALVDALLSGTIAGAGIDVFEQEPPPDDHPFFALQNIVLSPHRGGRTREATEAQGPLSVCRVLDVLHGSGWEGAVNHAALEAGQSSS